MSDLNSTSTDITDDTRTAALLALRAGLAVVPVRADGSKEPVITWRPYQQHLPTEREIEEWFRTPDVGLGIVCGVGSGNLELLEFESRAVAEGIFAGFLNRMIGAGLGELLEEILAGYQVQSPSGGLHLVYRCEEAVSGNQKLARRPATGAELAAKPADTIKPLIETRGMGGYMVTWPSNGRVHETGRPYELIAGSFETIPAISSDERETLLAIASEFDAIAPQPARKAATHGNPDDERPGGDYNLNGDHHALLVEHGWVHVGSSREGRELWRRPGKERGHSATWTPTEDGGYFRNFSSSVELPMDRAICRFALFTTLTQGGMEREHFRAAARKLAEMGYGAAPDAKSSSLVLVTVSEVEKRAIEWTWDRRIPRSAIGILAGDGGVGKSYLTTLLTSCITRGWALPGEDVYDERGRRYVDRRPDIVVREAGRVLIFSAEDTVEEVIRARLEVHGADLSMADVAKAVRRVSDKGSEDRFFSLADDLSSLDQVLGTRRYELVIIDPLTAYFHSDTRRIDAFKDADVRSVLGPVADMAARHQTAMLGIMHLGKNARDKAIYRMLNSVAFGNAARVVNMLGSDKDDETIKHLVTEKHNYSAKPPSLKFQLLPVSFADVPRLTYLAETEMTSDQLLSAPAKRDDKLPEAIDWLQECLGGGMVLQSTVKESATKKAGLAWRTVERAKEKLKVESRRRGFGPEQETFWWLPGTSEEFP